MRLSGTGSVEDELLTGPYGRWRYAATRMYGYAFTGQQRDAPSDIMYFHARYYDQQLGQFTSADSVNDGLNRYAYVHDNPETATDPTGHRPFWDAWNTLQTIESVVAQGAPDWAREFYQAQAITVAKKGLNNEGQRILNATRWQKKAEQLDRLLGNPEYQSKSYKVGGRGARQVDRAVDDAKLVSGDAADWARIAKWGGHAMMAAGAIIDFGASYNDYTSRHPEDPDVHNKAIASGLVHAGLSTAGAYIGGAIGMAIPVPGLDVAAALVFSTGEAMLGDWVADQVDTTVIDKGGFTIEVDATT